MYIKENNAKEIKKWEQSVNFTYEEEWGKGNGEIKE